MGLKRPKQYLPLAGKALLEWSLAPFLSADWIDGAVVVLARGDGDFGRLPIARHPKILTTAGGAVRLDSVLAGLSLVAELASIPETPVYVLVHDAAWPCVTVGDIERLCEEASDDQGGLLAVPLTETVKRETGERAEATVNGQALWRAQSPQVFRLDLLRQALLAARASGRTDGDEATAMESAGFRPRLVRGRESNLKITYAGDVPLAEFWLSRPAYLR